MPSITTPQELHAAFVELPDNVRHWLVSEKVSDIVGDMNTRLDYHGDKIGAIPWLITRLATKDLAPKYFMSELRDTLVVTDDEARTITEEIDKKILRPVELDLSRIGVDLNSLYLGQEAPARVEVGSMKYEVGMEGLGAQEQFGVAAGGEVRSMKYEVGVKTDDGQPTPAMPEGPVILHAEKEPPAPATPLPQSASRIEPPRPAFSLNIPQSKYKKPAAPPPVTVRIETPPGVIANNANREQNNANVTPAEKPILPNKNTPTNEPPKIMKVVHYSPFYTNIPKGNE